jgi:hypothetical protein
MPPFTAVRTTAAVDEPAEGGGEQALIRLNDVPRLTWLPRRRGGARLAVPTVHRWCARGLRGCRLHYVSVGGVRCTTEQWLRAFFAALAGGGKTADGRAQAIEGRGTPDGRSVAAAAAAERRLEREGF